MPFLAMILTAFLVQIVTGMVLDVLIDAAILGALWVWVKSPTVIPRWLRGARKD